MRALPLLLLLAVGAFAAGSGTYAFRGDKALRSGNFAKADRFYEQALTLCRKEADLNAEGRVLVAMAELRIQSLDLDLAEELLGRVHKEALDSASRAAYSLAWMELFLSRKDYGKVIEIKYSLSEEFLKKMSGGILGNVLCAAAVAFAGNGDLQNAQKYLDDAADAFDGDFPGRLSFARARVADVGKLPSADSLYAEAFELSVRGKRPFFSATILYYRGLNEKNPRLAKGYLERSARAFDLMGLPKNRDRSLDAAGIGE